MTAIQPADPKAKSKALLSVVAGALVGIGAFYLIDVYLGHIWLWLRTHTGYILTHHYLVFLTTFLLTLPIHFMTVSLIRFCNLIIHTQRFPPPDVQTIRAVKILDGETAVRRGKLLKSITLLLLFATIVLPFFAWYLVFQLSCVSA